MATWRIRDDVVVAPTIEAALARYVRDAGLYAYSIQAKTATEAEVTLVPRKKRSRHIYATMTKEGS